MDKQKLINHIRQQLMNDLAILKEAARVTAEAATHEESKPENEYDTRGLEASYLAGAQSKRIVDTEELLVLYKHLEPKSFGPQDPISATALVEVDLNDKVFFLFILPKGGGLNIEFEGQRLQTITPNSPLGEALLGLKAGQVALVERGNQVLEYEILSVQ
ncbi:GreA/GreB family elongation factor [Bdellovibrio svalbardensis]|uniref:GreA/GreB family elongation factor n=1 Tax=Bdellovibrio svalbardensis TaxID=2972972 RepID=A0ABT6DKP1_9BACT|nr:GreA/GreB family elongation factor [Bdellovibrio svalbardensis]MDG0816406.1 GreA/GreB family elongation factor [Bdellovibrio svalbardensis]